MSPAIRKTIIEHGSHDCIAAYRLNVKDGEGGAMIARELSVSINSTSSMIEAGEYLVKRVIQ